jgi:N-methylhydantoinase A
VNWFKVKQAELRERLLLDGISPNHIEFDSLIDARYLGQGYELPVKLLPTLSNVNELPNLFHSAHKALYGHANLDQPIEVVTLRLSARGSFPELEPVKIVKGGKAVDAEARLGIENVVFPGYPSGVDTAIYQREKLLAGNVFNGPCIVHQMDSTTVVLPGQVVTVTDLGDLLIREVKS